MSDLEIESEREERRRSFRSWLLDAWEWAMETEREELAEAVKELVDHATEPDYPLWEMARKFHVIGDSKRAEKLYQHLGMPPMQPERTGWEREINYSPIIMLEESLWRSLYQALGWVNRTSDSKINGLNFFLWSPNGNPVRFIAEQRVEVRNDQREIADDTQ